MNAGGETVEPGNRAISVIHAFPSCATSGPLNTVLVDANIVLVEASAVTAGSVYWALKNELI